MITIIVAVALILWAVRRSDRDEQAATEEERLAPTPSMD
jgi:hypothetical protein